MENEGYFQQDFGFYCVDAGFIPGELGYDIEGILLLELRKTHLYPIGEKMDEYSEDDLFDIIEFLYTHCSKPTKRYFHDWNQCGWHCETFDREQGQVEFKNKVNRLLNM